MASVAIQEFSNGITLYCFVGTKTEIESKCKGVIPKHSPFVPVLISLGYSILSIFYMIKK